MSMALLNSSVCLSNSRALDGKQILLNITSVGIMQNKSFNSNSPGKLFTPKILEKSKFPQLRLQLLTKLLVTQSNEAGWF